MNKKLRILMYSGLAITSLMRAGNHVRIDPILIPGELAVGILCIVLIVLDAIDLGKEQSK